MDEATQCIEQILRNKDLRTHVIVAIMGGDGTFAGILDTLTMNSIIKIFINDLVFTTLPFGTGNDMSRTLGWGGQEGHWINSVEGLVKELCTQNYDKFAIWEVEFVGNTFEQMGHNRFKKLNENG